MKEQRISKKRFETWLRENPDLSFTTCQTDACPVAIFLGSGCDHVVEVHGGSRIDIDGEKYRPPKWVSKVINSVDLHEPPDIPHEITARQVLDLL